MLKFEMGQKATLSANNTSTREDEKKDFSSFQPKIKTNNNINLSSGCVENLGLLRS